MARLVRTAGPLARVARFVKLGAGSRRDSRKRIPSDRCSCTNGWYSTKLKHFPSD
ncbi:hypothetical protein GGTG_13709 [Gaeumannomyces tritici R3-111a-1]|uniref:Uncharacterized protein n=1 Tax=Gaeumannomyces tritici (strain R3-111a-1) TaxID=644352 RepID=J3PJM2_GAET3|nr:hypothetical protein GGTG_13709 [Gaeumannomyces tritici R3-111a-1]EJT68722.1 hypothetical protein GGTG_13709 [Gaeumannomyces tritici R3-111a-1]